jgi:hypothetical protein
MDPENLTVKDVLIVISPIAALILGVIFIVQGMIFYAAIILVPLAILFAYSYMKMPWEEIAKKENDRRQRLQETKSGKIKYAFVKLIDYFSIVGVTLMALSIIGSIFVKIFANGS